MLKPQVVPPLAQVGAACNDPAIKPKTNNTTKLAGRCLDMVYPLCVIDYWLKLHIQIQAKRIAQARFVSNQGAVLIVVNTLMRHHWFARHRSSWCPGKKLNNHENKLHVGYSTRCAPLPDPQTVRNELHTLRRTVP